MRVLTFLAVFGLVVGFLGSSPRGQEVGKGNDDHHANTESELTKFQGTWQLVYAETDGAPAPLENVQKTRVVIEGSAHTVLFGNETVVHRVPFQIDPTTRPKSVVDTVPDGPNSGKRIQSIYRLEGDVLVSCAGAIDGERPKAFATRKDSGQTIRVFRRIGPPVREMAISLELPSLVGVWKFESLTMGGKATPEALLKSSSITIEAGGRFTSKDAFATYKGIMVIDPTTQPKSIDLIFTSGPEAGGSAKGLYSIEDNRFSLALGLSQQARPSELSSTPGSKHAFEVLKREPTP